ncbi:MAG TPA: hypothetical protein VFF48_02545, partial [Brevundimonas sp.]|nr:hypothetical protein [Brevundimonas sp.]
MIGVVEGAFDGSTAQTAIAQLFTGLTFENLGPTWPVAPPPHLDILVAGVDGASARDVEQAIARLRGSAGSARPILVLKNADVTTTRALIREGAADVLTAPVSDAALALSLERILSLSSATIGTDQGRNQVVAVLKAGGGVGASALIAQTGALIAARHEQRVCAVDLDVQFGCLGLYLDLEKSVTVQDCLADPAAIEETSFLTSLSRHGSGLSVMPAPRDLMPLEGLAPGDVGALVNSLRGEFGLTLLDMPSVWTAWTNRAMQLSDRIVLITRLSVPHIHLLRRQFGVLNAQGLNDKPTTVICNAVSARPPSGLSVKDAERALGRPFDLVIPDEPTLFSNTVNHGVDLAALRRHRKVEAALNQFAGV